MFRLIRHTFIEFALLSLSVATFAQNAQVTGVITDPNGAVVPAATVTLTAESTHAVLTSTTNEEGVYVFHSVPAGEYVLAVEATGLQDRFRQG